MKNLLVMVCVTFICTPSLFSQKYFTKNGKINIDATAASSPEKIEGVNRSVTCVLDTKTGNMQFAVLMKGFEFERALMEEHFNENYVESDKFPKAEFRGAISGNENINYTREDTYVVKVKGKLTMHGETREVETAGQLIIQGGKVKATSEFIVPLADYKVSVPGLVADKVSKSVRISIDCVLEPFKG